MITGSGDFILYKITLNLNIRLDFSFFSSEKKTSQALIEFHFSTKVYCHHFFFNKTWPEIRWDYPLNLSISISGGKENNNDSPSNGE